MNGRTPVCIDSFEVSHLNKRSISTGIWTWAGMLLLILDSKTALSGARDAVSLILYTVIPSLFPFFFLSASLTASAGSHTSATRTIGKLFRLPKGAECIVLPAFLGGYPSGAQAIGAIRKQGRITYQEGCRILRYCSNAGPSFLFGILAPCFPHPIYAWMLWMIQTAGALWISRLFPVSPDSLQQQFHPKSVPISDILRSALRVTGSVCAWVLLFRIVIAYLERWILWRIPSEFRILLSGLLELTNGCFRLQEISDVRIRFMICSGMLSTGGLCVAMQTKDVIGDLPIQAYLHGKALQTVFSISACILLLYRNPLPMFSLLVFTAVLYRKKQNSSGNPVILGV